MRMYVQSGELKGRRFMAPDTHATHPMSSRVLGALFNKLGDISGMRVLDAYAGSGAIAFEAVSRGASFVQAIDIDKKAHTALTKNITELGLEDRVKATRANCASWSDRNSEELFDLVILDPPYHKLNLSTVSLLTRHLKSSSLMVLSHQGREATPTVNGVVVVDNRNYGDAALSLYRKDNS